MVSLFFFFKQKTAYEIKECDWSSDVCSSDLPISGSTTVAGTVAASQSGPWTVGITGTPNVTVTNPATAPVFFRNVDDPGRTPYESSAQCVVSNNNSLCSAIFGAVPP